MATRHDLEFARRVMVDVALFVKDGRSFPNAMGLPGRSAMFGEKFALTKATGDGKRPAPKQTRCLRDPHVYLRGYREDEAVLIAHRVIGNAPWPERPIFGWHYIHAKPQIDVATIILAGRNDVRRALNSLMARVSDALIEWRHGCRNRIG